MQNRIAELRKEKGLTLAELAKKLDVNASTIQRYEIGKINPPLDKLAAMSKMFDCSIDYLICISNKRNIGEFEEDESSLTFVKPETKKIFSERLIDRMIQQDINKKELSEFTKIKKSELNAYIDGVEFPRLDYLKKISDQLNTTIDYLVGLTNDPKLNELEILEDLVEIDIDDEDKKITIDDIRKFLNSIDDIDKL